MSASTPSPKKVRKTIRRMMRDPVKWRITEHLFQALPEGTLSAVAAYHLASQIADDIVPIITRNLEEESTP